MSHEFLQKFYQGFLPKFLKRFLQKFLEIFLHKPSMYFFEISIMDSFRIFHSRVFRNYSRKLTMYFFIYYSKDSSSNSSMVFFQIFLQGFLQFFFFGDSEILSVETSSKTSLENCFRKSILASQIPPRISLKIPPEFAPKIPIQIRPKMSPRIHLETSLFLSHSFKKFPSEIPQVVFLDFFESSLSYSFNESSLHSSANTLRNVNKAILKNILKRLVRKIFHGFLKQVPSRNLLGFPSQTPT